MCVQHRRLLAPNSGAGIGKRVCVEANVSRKKNTFVQVTRRGAGVALRRRRAAMHEDVTDSELDTEDEATERVNIKAMNKVKALYCN